MPVFAADEASDQGSAPGAVEGLGPQPALTLVAGLDGPGPALDDCDQRGPQLRLLESFGNGLRLCHSVDAEPATGPTAAADGP
jgi:hypothetical protein